MSELNKLLDIVRKLRGEGGCPWDMEQTHESLKPCLIEEAAEVVGGINLLNETGNPDNLKEELGDLLLQVVMHSQIASEEGLFDIEDVAKCINDKMVRRHPHVFGDAEVSSSTEVLEKWDEIKKQEKNEKKNMADAEANLPEAFEESIRLIERAKKRKEAKIASKYSLT